MIDMSSTRAYRSLDPSKGPGVTLCVLPQIEVLSRLLLPAFSLIRLLFGGRGGAHARGPWVSPALSGHVGTCDHGVKRISHSLMHLSSSPFPRVASCAAEATSDKRPTMCKRSTRGPLQAKNGRHISALDAGKESG